MDSPNLRTRTNIEQRKHVGCTSAGDDYHSRPAVANDLLQEGYNPGIWISLVALGVEWRQSSVVIDQQYRMPCLRDSSQKRRELRDRKSTRLNSSHVKISYAVFCLKK